MKHGVGADGLPAEGPADGPQAGQVTAPAAGGAAADGGGVPARGEAPVPHPAHGRGASGGHAVREERVLLADLFPRLVRFAAWERGADGGRRLILHLVPENLGRVEVEMTLRAGDLHAAFTVDRPEVARMIQQQLPDLGLALRESGLSVAYLGVALGNSGGRGERNGAGERAVAPGMVPAARRVAGSPLPGSRAGPPGMAGTAVLDLLA